MRPLMSRATRRNMLIIKLAFVGLFGAACAGIWWYELAIGRPRLICLQTPGGEWQAAARACRVPPQYTCEKGGGWWEPISKTCAKVVSIPSITGRPNKTQSKLGG